MQRLHHTRFALAATLALTMSALGACAVQPRLNSLRAAALPSSGAATATGTATRVTVAAVAGGRPFAASSPWNVPTPSTTKWYDNVRLHRLVTPVNGSLTLHWWVNNESVGIHRGRTTDPLWTFRLPAMNAAAWHRVRPASTFVVHAPASMRAAVDTDHVLVLITPLGTYLEVWDAKVDPVRRIVTGTVWAKGSLSSGPGAGTTTVNDGTRASNLSWAGGLITGHDLRTGVIDHALALAVTSNMLKAGPHATYVWPATAWDNGGSTGPLKIGSRIGIPPTTPRPAGLSHVGNMVFDALKRYGAFIGDFAGGAWPMFYVDKLTVTEKQVDPLFAFWNYGGKADMDKIGPLLRVANYQP